MSAEKNFGLTTTKNVLLPALLLVAGAIDKKQSLPVLSNFLFKVTDNQLQISATDLEIEISVQLAEIAECSEGEITVPAKKIIDIVRSLDDQSSLSINFKGDNLILTSGRSKFKLATLAALDFPSIDREGVNQEFMVGKDRFTYLIHSTYFAMSLQDVRVYLNGLLLEFQGSQLVAVASDAHRMAICKIDLTLGMEPQRLLLPRKAVLELLRLLSTVEDSELRIVMGINYLQVETSFFTFTTKLIEARFPVYTKAIPLDNDKFVLIDKESLKRALSRIIILANEKSKAVLMQIQSSTITLSANNQELEEATETVEAQVDGQAISLGINAAYLLDVLQHINEETVRISLSSPDRSILVEPLLDEHYQYVIMPMTL